MQEKITFTLLSTFFFFFFARYTALSLIHCAQGKAPPILFPTHSRSDRQTLAYGLKTTLYVMTLEVLTNPAARLCLKISP